MSIPMQLEFNFASLVPKTAKQEAEAYSAVRWKWVEASVWTERMLAALGNGVKGGERMPFSLNVGFSPCAKPAY